MGVGRVGDRMGRRQHPLKMGLPLMPLPLCILKGLHLKLTF